MTETDEARRKRLFMRSMRRGIKEMDLILAAYATDHLPQMDDDALALYDILLSENDHDLYRWVTGQTAVPAPFTELIHDIACHAKGA